jgi:hypothetical protein
MDLPRRLPQPPGDHVVQRKEAEQAGPVLCALLLDLLRLPGIGLLLALRCTQVWTHRCGRWPPYAACPMFQSKPSGISIICMNSHE